jgi:hypothetical protein
MKTEVKCKECGRKFVKYSYSRMARCEECRRAAVEGPVRHAGNAGEAGKRLPR